MEKQFMPDVKDPVEKQRLLRDNCDDYEETRYVKPLSQEELDVKREELADNCIEFTRLEDELKEIKTGYKDRMDPLKDGNKILCQQIKTRQEEATGKLFHFNNHDDGMRYTYDEQGELVASRRLRPEEKQKRIPFIAKASGE
jgi:YD repeat-containing protein